MDTPLRTTDGQTALARRYERRLSRLIPRYAFLSLLCCLSGPLLYALAQRVPLWMEPVNVMWDIDRLIPLRAEWMAVYFGSYLFWVANFILVARRGQECWFRYFAAYLLVILCSTAVFLVFPTTMDRPVIPEDGTFSSFIMRFLFTVDAPKNLVPSLHCSTSLLCAMGLNGDKQTPLWYRLASYLFAVMVFASTLLVRQHCVVDVITGVALGLAAYLVCHWGGLWRVPAGWFERLDRRVFEKSEKTE